MAHLIERVLPLTVEASIRRLQHKENSFFPLLIFPCSSSEAAAGDGRVAPNIAWLSSRLSSHHFGFAMVGASRGDCRFSFTHSTRW